jgi:hypothetical protein
VSAFRASAEGSGPTSDRVRRDPNAYRLAVRAHGWRGSLLRSTPCSFGKVDTHTQGATVVLVPSNQQPSCPSIQRGTQGGQGSPGKRLAVFGAAGGTLADRSAQAAALLGRRQSWLALEAGRDFPLAGGDGRPWSRPEGVAAGLGHARGEWCSPQRKRLQKGGPLAGAGSRWPPPIRASGDRLQPADQRSCVHGA